MTCRELADFIAGYLDGELPSDVRAKFEHHLSLCPNCVAYLASYRAAITLGRRAFDEGEAALGLPEDLVKAILASRNPDA